MSAAFAFAPDDWRAAIHAAMKRQNVSQVAYVPDAGHASLIEAVHADPEMKVRASPCWPAPTWAERAACCSCSRPVSATA